MSAPSVAFSELSKNSKRVANTVDHARRIRITRRDGEDLYLTTERYDQQREETADVTARLFAALSGTDEGTRAIRNALVVVFPWARHLSTEESREFTRDLVNAARDVTELDVHANLHQAIVEWRATARAVADPEFAAQQVDLRTDENVVS
jgi:hypothetical protein